VHIKNPVEWFFAQLEATAEATAVVGGTSAEEYWSHLPADRLPDVQKIGVADVKAAMKQGLEDFFAARTDVIFLCLIYPVIGIFLAVVTGRGGVGGAASSRIWCRAATVSGSRFRNARARRLPRAVCCGVSPAAFSFSLGRDSFARLRSSSASSQISPK